MKSYHTQLVTRENLVSEVYQVTLDSYSKLSCDEILAREEVGDNEARYFICTRLFIKFLLS